MTSPKNTGHTVRRNPLGGILTEMSTQWTRGIASAVVSRRQFPRALRSRALRLMGQNVATSAIINAHVALAGTSRLEIGVRSFVNEGTYFDLAAPTTIGNDCAVGYQVMFVTATHAPGRSSRRAGPPEARPISVGDGTWIGARATILPGVTIGTGCIIAAGSVVTKDCEPNTLYGGVPARRIRALRDDHGNGIEVDE